MGTTRNCLFVSFFDTCWKRENVITIWAMNEYGVYDSWTKLVQIPSDLSLYNDPYIVPISILENGEVLMSDSSGLVLYNPKEKTVRTVLQLEHRADCALTYVETLVSPNKSWLRALIKKKKLPHWWSFDEVVGSCKGLKCLAWLLRHCIDILLWNPSTRIAKFLPRFLSPFSNWIFEGFGYDPTTEDYKIVLSFFTQLQIFTKNME
ncbi:hypothetical protein DVH24_032925 [Malus domestica]|uniref:F-box associated domain-containing protein n=1 Tax=Malus domestica TaxID=3750 RepID=A0A498IT67_MALDO|nr:hypothetical protein DVH24_032925 [Malus domestica]